MEIQRIDGYTDPRFPLEVLYQHGAFLVDGVPWAVRGIFAFTPNISPHFTMNREHVSYACRPWSGGRR